MWPERKKYYQRFISIHKKKQRSLNKHYITKSGDRDGQAEMRLLWRWWRRLPLIFLCPPEITTSKSTFFLAGAFKRGPNYYYFHLPYSSYSSSYFSGRQWLLLQFNGHWSRGWGLRVVICDYHLEWNCLQSGQAKVAKEQRKWKNVSLRQWEEKEEMWKVKQIFSFPVTY